MNSAHEDPGVANPFSTGGGGNTFEHLVGVSYLVTLLAGDIPRGLDWGYLYKSEFPAEVGGECA